MAEQNSLRSFESRLYGESGLLYRLASVERIRSQSITLGHGRKLLRLEPEQQLSFVEAVQARGFRGVGKSGA
ncbi:MAG: hypothetical protein U9O89_06920 [Thermoproteota archaeon]|nr:hypothetical protein [Thermoproteota archaeon]